MLNYVVGLQIPKSENQHLIFKSFSVIGHLFTRRNSDEGTVVICGFYGSIYKQLVHDTKYETTFILHFFYVDNN